MLKYFDPLYGLHLSPSIYSYEKEAIVQEVIRQGCVWRVYHNATIWTARCNKEAILYPGDVVYVVEMQNIILLIEPIASNERN